MGDHTETREEYEVRRAAIIADQAAQGWRVVTDAELYGALSGQTIYNGCSLHYLREKHGHANIEHVAGIDYFIKVKPVSKKG